MNMARYLGCCVGLLACLVTVGCGGGSGGSGSSTAGEPGSSTAGATTPSEHAPGTGRVGRVVIEEPAVARGIKGENTNTEHATKIAVTEADCVALQKLGEERLGTKLARSSDPVPPNSKCHLTGPGTSVVVYLDSGFAANQRYHNRIVEATQFNTRYPAGLPHYIPHVGEKAALNSSASWIPALGSLLAVRGNRWLTVTISVKGKSNKQLRDEAAVLARAGFRLTGGG